MKILKYISLALAFGALILYNACDAKKLELTNPNELRPEVYFTTAAQVQSAVNSVYGNLQTHGMYNRTMWFAYDNQAHENSGNPQLEADKREHLDFKFGPGHDAIGQYWTSCYRGINRANFVLNNTTKINAIKEEFLPKVTREKYYGEAKFMRALYYFFLVTRFGDVPLLTTDVPEDKKGLARTPAAQVYAQIEKDLSEAATQLLSKTVEDKGRATKEAAWALLGKVRLQQKKYAEALTAFQNVTGFTIIDNYIELFKEESENNNEQIFSVQFNIGAGNGDRWGAGDNDAGLNESTFRGQEYGAFDWFNVFPSKDLRNEFEANDPRYDYCFYYPNAAPIVNRTGFDSVPKTNEPGKWYKYPCFYQMDGKAVMDTGSIPPLTQSDGSRFDRIGWRKYSNYYKKKSENQESGINIIVIRYADVLLMMAECEANRTGGDLNVAVGYMNQIRGRASVDMDLYGTPAMDATYPVSTLPEFMVALEHERKVELCGEQVRLNDLIRWGRFSTFINYLKTTPGLLPLAEVEALSFDPAKHLLWPIPRKEIDANEKMTQNPGY
jgi:hypothetical protein